jgi:hypothetical protein
LAPPNKVANLNKKIDSAASDDHGSILAGKGVSSHHEQSGIRSRASVDNRRKSASFTGHGMYQHIPNFSQITDMTLASTVQ